MNAKRLLVVVAGVLVAAELAVAQGRGADGQGIRERRRDGSCVADGKTPPCMVAPKDSKDAGLSRQIIEKQQKLEALIQAPEVNDREVAEAAAELRSLQKERDARRVDARGVRVPAVAGGQYSSSACAACGRCSCDGCPRGCRGCDGCRCVNAVRSCRACDGACCCCGAGCCAARGCGRPGRAAGWRASDASAGGWRGGRGAGWGRWCR
jgi:hypothetical protein